MEEKQPCHLNKGLTEGDLSDGRDDANEKKPNSSGGTPDPVPRRKRGLSTEKRR